ncbi:hypothetical protein BCIN_07g01950 [Botrytis cinerea B05.10]|uniref:Uncharacterized protein n=1 Tax=Botryotinia fuckeliana (strain B05.10) TaxID=332648 RepID=A0A384JLW0_BOTFB|nr:hypothetical protein BCIN_07g01950 [Botrytis cinerea B05.10]ATZ51585.1 hypothetical protein BCIN_07g01950 [Botrytis cinerea B05.10]
MSTYYSPRHSLSRDVDFMRGEMCHFRQLPLDHVDRQATYTTLRNNLQGLLNSLRYENIIMENRISELRDEISRLSTGGGRMQVVGSNLAEENSAEIVSEGQQGTINSDIDTVEDWVREIQLME